MLSLTSATRVLVATTPVDLRGSFNRLYSLVIERLQADPLSGHLFVFTNRRWQRATFTIPISYGRHRIQVASVAWATAAADATHAPWGH
jgi:transposase